jgi:hypothetical protein
VLRRVEALIAEWRSQVATSGAIIIDPFRPSRRQFEAQPDDEEPPEDEGQKRDQVLRGFDAYLAVDEECAPPTFETGRRRLEWALTQNLFSPNMPKSFDTSAKIAADALWRLLALSIAPERLESRHKLRRIMETLDERLTRLGREVAKARGWSNSTEPAPRGVQRESIDENKSECS